MSFCCSLAWLDSILRWCVQFQAQMNLPAQVHLRKDVGRDWSSGIPGWRELLQSDWEQFSFLFFFSLSLFFFYIKTHFFEFADKGNVSFLPVPCLGFYLHSLFGQLWQWGLIVQSNIRSQWVNICFCRPSPQPNREQPATWKKTTTTWLNIIQPERETKKI